MHRRLTLLGLACLTREYNKMLLSSLQPLDIDRLPFDKYILTPAVIDRCKFQSYFRVLRESMIEIYISHRARRHSLDFKYTPPCYSRELFYLARVGSSEGAKQKLHRIAWRWGNEGHRGSPPPRRPCAHRARRHSQEDAHSPIHFRPISLLSTVSSVVVKGSQVISIPDSEPDVDCPHRPLSPCLPNMMEF